MLKVISWNVNGIQSAWRHGLPNFIRASCADILAFQETKLSSPLREIGNLGYKSYWSFCKKKHGYSGTLCLSRYEPIRVAYDFSTFMDAEFLSEHSEVLRQFDTEGRIITLEFDDLFVVNCYVPNSLRNNERYDYRDQWDELFTAYLFSLKQRKSVIVCGDLNVAISDADIFPESKWRTTNKPGYQTTERECLLNILQKGYIDSFRKLHPSVEKAYTWWSNRRNRRIDNKGWRLDYILVSEDIQNVLLESNIHSDIYGSDHCPISLTVDISSLDNANLEPPDTPIFDFSIIDRLSSYDKAKYIEHMTTEEKDQLWDELRWPELENRLEQMQTALAKVAYTHNKELIIKWQKRITYSIEAKLLAVRHVCAGNPAPGIDNIRWASNHEKVDAALALTSREYKAMPSVMILLKTKDGKTRRIHVETLHDRAMQVLYSMSLDPIAESWADRRSFAFRKGRSSFDAHEYILSAFSPLKKRGYYENQDSFASAPEWAFIGDIKQCYEHICHNWILSNIPMAKTVLHEFLSAGYIMNGELFPTEEGVGIGLVTSPIIANMTLDGMQEYIYSRLTNGSTEKFDYRNGFMIRYADDFVISARTEDDAHRIREIVKDFLAPRGLELSDSKSRIANVREGFNFLSRFYVRREDTILAYPAEYAVERFLSTLRLTVVSHTGSQKSLIDNLNRKLSGWATYHKVEHATDAFRHVDTYLKALLLESCHNRHPTWSRNHILAKYWYMDSDGQYYYALPNKREVRVRPIKDTLLTKHYAIPSKFNPYIETGFMEWRKHEREITNVTGRYRYIWNRQEGVCYYCGKPILPDQEKIVAVVDATARKRTGQLAYIHQRCSTAIFSELDDIKTPVTVNDVIDLIESLNYDTLSQTQQYRPLADFFRISKKRVIHLSFHEIEDILGFAITNSTHESKWWLSTKLSSCWEKNGFSIQKIDLIKGRISFRQTLKKHSTLDIPDVFLSQRIPDDAKYELENYMQYIIKKYGL